jgi:hypothetical protein
MPFEIFNLVKEKKVKFCNNLICDLPEWRWFIHNLEENIKKRIEFIKEKLLPIWEEVNDEIDMMSYERNCKIKKLYKKIVETRQQQLHKGIKIYLSLPRSNLYASFANFYNYHLKEIFEYASKFFNEEREKLDYKMVHLKKEFKELFK